MPLPLSLADAFESFLFITGIVVLWRYARRAPVAAPLPRWEVPSGAFFLSLWVTLLGYIIPGVAFYYAADRFLKLDDSSKVIIVGMAAQVGMFAAWFLGRRLIPGMRVPLVPEERRGRSALGAGATVFLMAMPVVIATSAVWQKLLELAGIPIVPQDLIGIFNNASSPLFIALLLGLAVIGAPITEELVFRAGLFRFARNRIPRAAALLVPAVIFATAHANLATFLPLTVLGVMFSLAFERTADIRVSMVAHALFNLNSSMLVLLGGAGGG